MTEAEVFADQDHTHVKIAQEDFDDEVFRRESREFHREGHHDGRLKASYAKPFHALDVGRESLGR